MALTNVNIKIKKLHPDAILPSYAHPGDAGLDIYSVEDKIIKAGERILVSTGISIEIPEGFVGLVWDKSGLANNFGLKTMGGVMDAGYRGEYKIVLFNTSKEDYFIKRGSKIAQLLVQPIITAEIEQVQELSDTSRGQGGFGSTGLEKK
jgi:dUTP pyrophosphatase